MTLLLVLTSVVISKAQYIAEVYEYKPAPGQYINSSPYGVPSSAHSIVDALNGTLNLGAFGGYVIFRFEKPVENHEDNPYGIDFSVFGNPSEQWSEPGVVSVMKDENGNGLPDDTWYELAGSDHYFSTTIREYKITYENPGEDEAADVPWKDNQGNQGFIYENSFHTQPYYPLNDSFPSINKESYSLEGTRLKSVVDTSNPSNIKFYKRAFGYADNQQRGTAPYTMPDNPYTREKENSGGDAFDIDWAIDSSGNYVNLDTVHFVKVHNGIMANAGWMGEISTEITGAVDVEPDSTVSGVLDMVVIKDLPRIIDTSAYQLEAYAFHKGRLKPGKDIQWSVSSEGASIDENNVISVQDSGAVTISASLADDPSILDSVSTVFDIQTDTLTDDSTHTDTTDSDTTESDTTETDTTENDEATFISERNDAESALSFEVYPNPARHYIRVQGVDKCNVRIFNVLGSLLYERKTYIKNERISLERWKKGIYLIEIRRGDLRNVKRFIKR
jgi:hypothetical protein